MTAQYWEKDGILYSLFAKEDKGKWFGSWICDSCKTPGESIIPCDSEQEAYEAAKTNLQGHHSIIHGKS